VAIAIALAALLLAGGAAAGAAILLRADRLKRRHRAVLGAPLPVLDAGAERLVDAPRALYHGTRFADGTALLDPVLARPCVADLYATAQAIFIQREAGEGSAIVPLPWVEDALLARQHAELAGRELPVLKLRWRRGGELLETSVSLRGGLPQLEKLRREVHLRQGQGGAMAALQKYLEAKP
jgi:hypothetical protein